MLAKAPLSSNHQIGAWLFPAILAASILQNYFDINEILNGGALDLQSYEGPIVFKLFKDILYLSLILRIFFTAANTGRWPLSSASIIFIAIVFISSTISAVLNDFTVAAIGLRWIVPFVIFLLLRDFSARIHFGYGIIWMFFGLIACLGAQLYELFHMPPIYGEILGGWPARTPGFFLAPNSAAFFSCCCCACICVFSYGNFTLRLTAGVLSMMICLLAQSGTGIVVAAILLIWIIERKLSPRALVVATITGALIFLNLDAITMRDDYVAASGGNRVDVFLNTLGSVMTSIGKFGIYTNASTLQNSSFALDFAADSLWASWFGNFGVLAPIQIALVGLFVIKNMRVVNWKAALPCVLVFCLFSMTTIIFEAFPMNLLLAVGIWSSQNVPCGFRLSSTTTRPAGPITLGRRIT